MSKNQNKQDQLLEYLMSINNTLGEHTGLIKGMHEKQDYTNGRVNRLESELKDNDTEIRKDIKELQERTTETKTKVAVGVSIIAASDMTDNNAGGNNIATHVNGNGVVTQINETITNILPISAVDGVTGALTQFSLVHQKEGGVNDTIDLSDLIETVTGFTVAGDVITYTKEDGGTDTATLNVTKTPLYEYRDIWAEENSTLVNNSAEWSFGAGAEGYIGLPIDSGWEVIAMYYHSDTNGATDDLTVNLIDIATNPSATAPTIATVTMVDSGSGQANNAWVFQDMLAAPVAVPANAVLGFRTGTEVGNISDARVGARLRRQIGEYVSDVQLI